MSAETIANDFAAQQGWNDTTLLDLALTYIDRQGDNDAFADYLRGIAEQESPRCPLCGGPMDVLDFSAEPFCVADCQGDTDDATDVDGEGEPEHLEGPDGTCTDECVATHPDHVSTRGEEEDFYPLTCAHCGRAISPFGRDETGSRRCDDLDPGHPYHRAETPDTKA